MGGRTLRGVVTDATGGPIAGARIDAAKIGGLSAPSTAVATTLTGPTGEYSLSVAEGQLLVAASEPSDAPQSRYVDVGPASAVASFALVPGGVIEGLVRDEQSREPVAGATVEARRDQPALALGERALVHAGLQMSRAPTTIGIGVAEQVSDRIEAKAGKSGLLVLTPPAPTTRMGLVLEAGKTLDVGTITVAAPSP